MSCAIIRNENHKMNAVPLLERHNERLNHNYSNKDIDLSRTSENYHLKKIQAETYQQEFERIHTRQELKGNLRLHGEKQSTATKTDELPDGQPKARFSPKKIGAEAERSPKQPPLLCTSRRSARPPAAGRRTGVLPAMPDGSTQPWGSAPPVRSGIPQLR